ncbi:hypothetical protein [Campylobacter fetus]|uniref:hypothetical protein n=1 Tax=Campylobacter fetus TaxID=196 RepID=UPI00081881A9|nr:hypothetical protein [Campylobacter fetus]OCR88072.1 hypothetical protein CFT13S00388_02585 [Campylobacter fetus subsp. testudinum]RUT50978.1 hypothetical protein BWK67_00195 [Campylobacter fetus]RUT51706.1 hypothetical protein BWK51_00195 [Campylobacter fetus]
MFENITSAINFVTTKVVKPIIVTASDSLDMVAVSAVQAKLEHRAEAAKEISKLSIEGEDINDTIKRLSSIEFY